MTESCSCIIHCPLNHSSLHHNSNNKGSFDSDHFPGAGQGGSGGNHHHHGGQGGHGTSGSHNNHNSFNMGHQNFGSSNQFEECEDGDQLEIDDLI